MTTFGSQWRKVSGGSSKSGGSSGSMASMWRKDESGGSIGGSNLIQQNRRRQEETQKQKYLQEFEDTKSGWGNALKRFLGFGEVNPISVAKEIPSTIRTHLQKTGRALEEYGFEPTKSWEQMSITEKLGGAATEFPAAMTRPVLSSGIKFGSSIAGVGAFLGYPGTKEAALSINKYRSDYEKGISPQSFNENDNPFNNPSLLFNPEYTSRIVIEQLPNLAIMITTAGYGEGMLELGEAFNSRMMSNEKAGREASPVDRIYAGSIGLINGAIGKMGFNAIFNKSKVLQSFAEKHIASALRKTVKAVVATGVEMTGEYIQEVIPQIATKVVFEEGGTWKEVLAQAHMQGKSAAGAAGVISGPISATSMFAQEDAPKTGLLDKSKQINIKKEPILPPPPPPSIPQTISTVEAKQLKDKKKTYLEDRKKFVSSFVDSKEGERAYQAIAEKESRKESIGETDISIISGIKNNSYYRKEKTIKDTMGSGYLLKKGDKYIIAEQKDVERFVNNGWEKGMEVDSLAKEAGFESGEDYLNYTLEQINNEESLSTLEKEAHNILIEKDNEYIALNNEINKLNVKLKNYEKSKKETRKIADTEKEEIARVSEEKVTKPLVGKEVKKGILQKEAKKARKLEKNTPIGTPGKIFGKKDYEKELASKKGIIVEKNDPVIDDFTFDTTYEKNETLRALRHYNNYVRKGEPEGQILNKIENGYGIAIRYNVEDISKAKKAVTEPLVKEISKAKAEGKSFDEFVKAQGTPVYHTTRPDIWKKIKTVGFKQNKDGKLFFSASPDYSKSGGLYSAGEDAIIQKVILPKDAKILRITTKNIEELGAEFEAIKKINKLKTDKQTVEWLENNGWYKMTGSQRNNFFSEILKRNDYSGLSFIDGLNIVGGETIVLYDKNIISQAKTKSQLKQLWDKGAKPLQAGKEVKKGILQVAREEKLAKTRIAKEARKVESQISKAKADETPSALYAKKWEVKMSQEQETGEKINKTQILNWAEKTFNIPLRAKATHKWKASGMYYPKEQIVRMAKWGELSVLTHELAHHIDFTFRKTLGRKWYRQTRVITTELANLDYDKSKRRTEEGFAEYMRHRMTTGKAKELAPNFDKFFNEFLEEHKELKYQLEEFKKKLDIWHGQGAENRIIQQIDWKGEHTKVKGILNKLKNALKFVNEKFNDEFYVPQKIVSEIEKVIGRKLSPRKNPAILMEYSKSKAGAIAKTFVMKKAINEKGDVVGPSLVEILKPISNKEMKQFISYAVSKRALNLAGRNIESGFDIDDAKFVIEKYKDRGWDETANGLTEWSNNLLDWVVRAGGLKKETARHMRDLNPTYLIFKRAFLDEVGVIKGAGGYVDTGGAIKGIKGSGRPIINPIEAMIGQSRELIAKSQKIRIANTFINLANEEGVGGFITKVPAPMKATTFSASQIKSYLDEIASGEEGVMSSDEYNELLTVFTQDFSYNGKENIVSVWKNGKQVFYEIHPELYEAFKGVDPLKLGPIARVLAPFSRMLRLGATGLKFSFGLARNPFRDAFSYVVFSKRNKVTVFDPIKGVYDDLTTKPGEATWRFKALGGALSGQIGFDRGAVQNTYDEMLLEKLGKKGKVLKIVKHPVNAFRDLISVTEMGPRSIELEQSYKKYNSKEWIEEHPDWNEEDAFIQAFIDAQDVTVNFTKSGKWAKQINEVTAFFNVAIRGPEKMYRSFAERPVATTVKGILWLTSLAVYSWWRNKDEDWYKNLPPAYKYNNLFFNIGPAIIRLPIPFELGVVFMSAPQAALDTMKDPSDRWAKGLLDLAKAQIPDPTPSAFGPLIDVKTNKNYLGVPIESAGMQYLYPTERKKSYTSKFAIGMSKGLDKIGFSLSPIQLDYMIDSYSGGFLKQFKVKGEEIADLPVIGDLMLRDPDYPRRQLNEYFSDYEVLKQKKQADIISKEEKRKLNKIDGFYTYYKDKQKLIKKAKDKNNNELLKKYYDQLINKLEHYGY